MSQAPQYSPSEIAAYGAMQGSSSALPTSVRVISIISAILGGLTLGHNIFGLLLYAGTGARSTPFGPVFAQYNIINACVFGAFAAVCFLASLGCLARIELARKVLVGYAMAYIVATIFSETMMFLYVIPEIMQPALGRLASNSAAMAGVYIGAVIPGIFCLVLPVLILAFFKRPAAKAAFVSA